jgi:hypothetical protein
MAGKHHELTVVCVSCKGCGVIVDKDDPTVGVVCAGCSGRGFTQLAYEPFTGRRKLDGIKRVRRSGQGITAFSPAPSPDAGVAYTDFLKGKFP